MVALALQACGGGGGGPGNRAPTLGNIGNQSVDEGTSTVVSVSASDPDADPLTFSVSSLPAFVTFEILAGNTARLTVAPGFSDSGDYSITVSVRDGAFLTDQETFTLGVTDVNRAPALAGVADETIAEGQTRMIGLSATDPDADAIVLAGIALPAFASIDDNGNGTGTLTLAPGFFDSGDYTITLRASDAGALTDEQSFALTVGEVNRAPALAAVGNQMTAEGLMQVIALSAIDADGDDLAFIGLNLPPFAALGDNGDGTGSLMLAPGFFDSGDYPITLRVLDSRGATDEETFTVSVGEVNQAPVLAAIGDRSIPEDTTQLLALGAADADGDAVTLSGFNLPPFATFSDHGDGTGSLALAPGFSDSGDYAITVLVLDSRGAADEETFTLSVTNVNRIPALAVIGNQTIAEGDSQVIAVSASDPDGDTLSLGGFNLPPFATFTDNGDGTGSLSLAPGFFDSGDYELTVLVLDTEAGADEETFTVSVGDVNQAPVLSGVADQTITEGQTQLVPLSATDADGNAIVLSAIGLPVFATINDNGDGTGAVTLAPRYNDAGSYSFTIRSTDNGTPSLSDDVTVQLTVANTTNQVAEENMLPGTADWALNDPATLREIEGYASATSVDRGASISLFVNTNAPTFTLEVFRMGWYQGLGARRVHGPALVAGTPQFIPSPDPITGLVEANWTNPYVLQTADSVSGDPWATGVYLARLTESLGNKQSYIIFVVRDDAHRPDVLFQLPVTTYQAYNAWGGKSTYDFNSGPTEPWGSTPGARATHVSFDRPYARNDFVPAAYGMGAGEFLTNVQPVGRIDGAGWDYNMVRWLEYEQYDVGYITNVDTHRSPARLLDTDVFLSQGHDEYWSWEMRDNVEAARDAGVDLAFFASNAAYFQIRYEPSPATSAPDRVMVVYKNALLDPVFTDADPTNDHLTTVRFRDAPVARPEQDLIGVQYVLDPVDGDIVVTNPGHWVFANTGLADQSRLVGLLGYEPDKIFGVKPANVEILAESPIVSTQDPSQTDISHMTISTAASGASVFATGSLQWSWGLDDYNAPALRTSRLSAAAQQITDNVLETFGATPITGDTIQAACVRLVGLSDESGDNSTSAAEIDLLDANGVELSKAQWSLFFADSEETVGLNGAAVNAFDADPQTFWQTLWFGPAHPHEIQIDLGGLVEINALRYLPRQDGVVDGTIGDYEIYTSPDCASWSLAAAGTWQANSGRKTARFTR